MQERQFIFIILAFGMSFLVIEARDFSIDNFDADGNVLSNCDVHRHVCEYRVVL